MSSNDDENEIKIFRPEGSWLEEEANVAHTMALEQSSRIGERVNRMRLQTDELRIAAEDVVDTAERLLRDAECLLEEAEMKVNEKELEQQDFEDQLGTHLAFGGCHRGGVCDKGDERDRLELEFADGVTAFIEQAKEEKNAAENDVFEHQRVVDALNQNHLESSIDNFITDVEELISTAEEANEGDLQVQLNNLVSNLNLEISRLNDSHDFEPVDELPAQDLDLVVTTVMAFNTAKGYAGQMFVRNLNQGTTWTSEALRFLLKSGTMSQRRYDWVNGRHGHEVKTYKKCSLRNAKNWRKQLDFDIACTEANLLESVTWHFISFDGVDPVSSVHDIPQEFKHPKLFIQLYDGSIKENSATLAGTPAQL